MAVTALARNLKLSDGDAENLAGLRTAAVLRHDLPLQRAGETVGSRDPEDDELVADDEHADAPAHRRAPHLQ